MNGLVPEQHPVWAFSVTRVMSGAEIAEAMGRRAGAVEPLWVRGCATSSQWSQEND
jgi:hypothetical protein